MPTEEYSYQAPNGPKPYLSTVWGLNGPAESPRVIISEGRTFIKRPKPRDAFIAPTPYETHVWVIENTPVKADVSGNPDLFISIDGPVQPFLSILQEKSQSWFPGFSTNLENGVITDLRLKVKDQSVNLAQAWAERRMTAGLMADSVNRIAKATQLLRKKQWRKAGRMLKQSWKKAPQSWLEFQYGWKPLMQDVYGSCEALAKLQNPTDWVISVKSGRKVEADRFDTWTTALSKIEHSCDLRAKSFQGVFIRVDYRPSNYFLSTLSSNTGITNPALIAWELVPYSFVIDWFVQVGDWISSLDATQYMEFLGGSVTDRRELNITLQPRDSTNGYGSTTSWRASKQVPSARRFLLRREPLNSWPIASAPRFKDPLSLVHVANALSLLAVALRPGPVRLR